MENKEEFFKCSYYNCGKSFRKDYLSSGLKTPPINDEDKFHQILEGLMKTRLFCLSCTIKHATIICLNSKIQIEK
jgi:hypothetical protein